MFERFPIEHDETVSSDVQVEVLTKMTQAMLRAIAAAGFEVRDCWSAFNNPHASALS